MAAGRRSTTRVAIAPTTMDRRDRVERRERPRIAPMRARATRAESTCELRRRQVTARRETPIDEPIGEAHGADARRRWRSDCQRPTWSIDCPATTVDRRRTPSDAATSCRRVHRATRPTGLAGARQPIATPRAVRRRVARRRRRVRRSTTATAAASDRTRPRVSATQPAVTSCRRWSVARRRCSAREAAPAHRGDQPRARPRRRPASAIDRPRGRSARRRWSAPGMTDRQRGADHDRRLEPEQPRCRAARSPRRRRRTAPDRTPVATPSRTVSTSRRGPTSRRRRSVAACG